MTSKKYTSVNVLNLFPKHAEKKTKIIGLVAMNYLYIFCAYRFAYTSTNYNCITNFSRALQTHRIHTHTH